MAKQRKTSEKAATAASKVLRDGRTGKDSKTAAASALAQAAPKKKPLPNAPSKKEGQKSGTGRGNAEPKKATSAPKPAPKPASKPAPKPAAKPVPKPAAKPAPRPSGKKK